MSEFKTKKGTMLPLMQLQGKDYLLVAHRIQWFREDYPLGRFESRCIESTAQYVVYQADVSIPNSDGDYIKLADAIKREDYSHFRDAHEKAQTGAIGRALALIGYGTQFTGTELDEGNRLADAPVPRIEPRQTNPGTNSTALTCDLCGTGLLKSKKGGMYCPNFKDKSRGEHTFISAGQLLAEKPAPIPRLEDLPFDTHPELQEGDLPF